MRPSDISQKYPARIYKLGVYKTNEIKAVLFQGLRCNEMLGMTRKGHK
jgi:hypothetical protein